MIMLYQFFQETQNGRQESGWWMQPRALASVSRRVIAICECALCGACLRFFCGSTKESRDWYGSRLALRN